MKVANWENKFRLALLDEINSHFLSCQEYQFHLCEMGNTMFPFEKDVCTSTQDKKILVRSRRLDEFHQNRKEGKNTGKKDASSVLSTITIKL